MVQNLDLESWEKENNLRKKPKTIYLDDSSLSRSDKSNPSLNNFPSFYKDVMEGDEIINVIVPKVNRSFSRFFIKIPFILAALFFLFTLLNLMYMEKNPIFIFFLLPPFLIFFQLFKSPQKRYFIMGRKSFYYADLMDRPIFYTEIKDVQLITTKLRRNTEKESFYYSNLLCFFFHDEIQEDLVGEARFLRHAGQYDEVLTNDRNLAIFPHRFPIQEIIKAIKG